MEELRSSEQLYILMSEIGGMISWIDKRDEQVYNVIEESTYRILPQHSCRRSTRARRTVGTLQKCNAQLR